MIIFQNHSTRWNLLRSESAASALYTVQRWRKDRRRCNRFRSLLNRTSHECIFNERSLTLTPIEFEILWLLCENRGKVISSEELFRKVWKEEYYKNSNNTVMVHIRHLREKMSGPTGKSGFHQDRWGVGYKVEE